MRSSVLLGVLAGLCMAGVVSAETLESAQTKFEARDPNVLPAIEMLAKANPSDVTALVLLGSAQSRARQFEAAVKTLDRAVALAPDMAEAHFRLGEAYAGRVNEVSMFSKLSIAGKIRDGFQKAVELDADHHEARLALAQFYLAAPSVAGGSAEKAAAATAELMRRNPARGHMARAMALEAEKKPAEALREYEAAVAAEPGYRNARLTLGMAYQRSERWTEAFAVYEAMLREKPDDVAAVYQLGRTAALSGQRLDDGQAALERFLALPVEHGSPPASGAHFRIGMIHAKSGRIAEARASYQTALKLDPKNEEARSELAKLKG